MIAKHPSFMQSETTAKSLPPPATKSGRNWVIGILAAVLVAISAVVLKRMHSLPSFTGFGADFRSISVVHILLGLTAIYIQFFVRSVRWALLMPRENRPPALSLTGTQFVGFAAVALFGRVADLTRPYLVARRTDTPVAMQIAVYSVERALDLAATAVLFSLTLLLVPRTAPHHEAFSRAGVLASAGTAFLLTCALILRGAGKRIAHFVRRRLRKVLPKWADSIANRILELQSGFATLRSTAQLAGAFAWSMVIWILIALAYFFTTHCLPETPQLAGLGMAAIMLLLATSMGASLLQLPVLGWFTQIAALAAAYHTFFGVPSAAASLCGLLTFAVNTLSVIPPGLALARWSGLSLREGRRTTEVETA